MPQRSLRYVDLIRFNRDESIFLQISLLNGLFLASKMNHAEHESLLISSTRTLALYIAFIIIRCLVVNEVDERSFSNNELVHPSRGMLSSCSEILEFISNICGFAFIATAVITHPAKLTALVVPSTVAAVVFAASRHFPHFPRIVHGPIISAVVFAGAAVNDLTPFVQYRRASTKTSSAWIGALEYSYRPLQVQDRAILYLYLATTAWAVFYEIIHQFKDAIHDYTAGVPMTALLVRDWISKPLLAALVIIQHEMLCRTGVVADSGPLFFIFSVGAASLCMVVVLWHVQLKTPESCIWWSSRGGIISGAAILLGIVSDYASSEGLLQLHENGSTHGVIKSLLSRNLQDT